jgi:hypothetical protein
MVAHGRTRPIIYTVIGNIVFKKENMVVIQVSKTIEPLSLLGENKPPWVLTHYEN